MAHPVPDGGSSPSRPPLSLVHLVAQVVPADRRRRPGWPGPAARRGSRRTAGTTNGDAAAVEHVVALADVARGGHRVTRSKRRMPSRSLGISVGAARCRRTRRAAPRWPAAPSRSESSQNRASRSGRRGGEAPAQRERRSQARHPGGRGHRLRHQDDAVGRRRPRRRRAGGQLGRGGGVAGAAGEHAGPRARQRADRRRRPHSGDPRRLPMISDSASAPPTRVATVSTTRRQVQRWIRTGGSR